ncbi:MAG: hypothetical protein IJS37_03855 [Bacilli bacterium]|nr:hypothetical protein [Bacilli bacterium]
MAFLNGLFSSIQRFAVGRYPDAVIEKVTGSRLHLYIEDKRNQGVGHCILVMLNIAVYAYGALKTANENSAIALSQPMNIRIGANYGEFRVFSLEEEETSIGYAANFACKLLSVTQVSTIAIAKDDYQALNVGARRLFAMTVSPRIKKYTDDGSGVYYAAGLHLLFANMDALNAAFDDDSRRQVLESFSRHSSRQILMESANSLSDLDRLSENRPVKISGSAIFADIRGFTLLFEPDDSNLNVLVGQIAHTLQKMRAIVDKSGKHIQIQGDKEVGVFAGAYAGKVVSVGEAVRSGMNILDFFAGEKFSVGIGMASGPIYVAKVGIRNNTDVVIFGRTVSLGDWLQETRAEEGDLVITDQMHNELLKEPYLKFLANQFKPIDYGLYWKTDVGLTEYTQRFQNNKNNEAIAKKEYPGAYRSFVSDGL